MAETATQKCVRFAGVCRVWFGLRLRDAACMRIDLNTVGSQERE